MWYATIGAGVVATGLGAAVTMVLAYRVPLAWDAASGSGSDDFPRAVGVWAVYLLAGVLLGAAAVGGLRAGGVTDLRARLAVSGTGALILAWTPSILLQGWIVLVFALACTWLAVWVVTRWDESGADADAKATQAV